MLPSFDVTTLHRREPTPHTRLLLLFSMSHTSQGRPPPPVHHSTCTRATACRQRLAAAAMAQEIVVATLRRQEERLVRVVLPQPHSADRRHRSFKRTFMGLRAPPLIIIPPARWPAILTRHRRLRR